MRRTERERERGKKKEGVENKGGKRKDGGVGLEGQGHGGRVRSEVLLLLLWVGKNRGSEEGGDGGEPVSGEHERPGARPPLRRGRATDASAC